MPILLADPRHWQILTLGTLLGYAYLRLDLDQPPMNVAVIMASAVATQVGLSRWLGVRRHEVRSAIITSLSLSLLLRAGTPWLLGAAASIAMASKFAIRVNGKHVYNPANLAIVVMLLATDAAWISPAQWGSTAWTGLLIASLAILVLSRARRGDIALAFLGAYAGILVARALYLGDPLAIPMRQMQSGAVLLFAFFMISDPKTVPDRRPMRILFALLTAVMAAYLQFVLYLPQGLMYALFLAAPLVPLLDKWHPVAPENRFEWSRPSV